MLTKRPIDEQFFFNRHFIMAFLLVTSKIFRRWVSLLLRPSGRAERQESPDTSGPPAQAKADAESPVGPVPQTRVSQRQKSLCLRDRMYHSAIGGWGQGAVLVSSTVLQCCTSLCDTVYPFFPQVEQLKEIPCHHQQDLWFAVAAPETADVSISVK